MSTVLEERERVYEQLCQWVEDDPRRLAILADLMIAVPLSRSLQSPDLAENIIRDVQDQSIAQMLRRFYKNDAVTWEKFYWPIIEQLLDRLDLEVYYLVADTTSVGQDHRALVLSLAYHKRSLPLIWHIEPGSKGHTSEDLQVELLKRLHDHFHPDKLVIFLGDSEFDGVKVQQRLDLQGWYYACRTSPSLYVYPDGGEDGFPLGDLVPEPGSPEQQLDDVEFTAKHRHGPVSCYACWEEPHEEPLILICHLPPGWSPRPTYKPRFWTEPLFGDCKEGGFRLSTSRLKHAERLSRLFLVVALAYVWMVCLGVQAICEGVADLVDRSNIDRPRSEVMQQMLADNMALIVGRAGHVVESESWNLLFCGRGLIDTNIYYRGGGVAFPLYLYNASEKEQSLKGGGSVVSLMLFESRPEYETRDPNLSPKFIVAVEEKLGLKFVREGKGDLEITFGPEDILHYAYAVFHSPTYRERYAEFLKIDFPRLPLTSGLGLFKALAERGEELVSLHLMESPKPDQFITKFDVPGSSEVEKVRYMEPRGDVPGRVYINKTQYFEGIEPGVWEFQIGGYQVLHKWLKDRKGRKLIFDDFFHYQKIVVALKETMRLMGEIDGLIPSWPIE